MTAKMHPHAWSAEPLLDKAQRYASVMLDANKTDWQYGFWSVLTLEMLARAALAKVSPTLLADGKDWNHTYYALGRTPTAKKYIPRSIDITEVFKRLEAILLGFNREVHNFCIQHVNLRNTELHSGDLPFDKLGTSSWLPKFYLACKVLLESLGHELEFLFGPDEAEVAEKLIQSLEDKAARAISKTIQAHKDVWNSKGDKERAAISKRSEALAARHVGHRVKCPSCGNTALLHGNPIGVPTTSLEDDIIVQRQSMLPSHFECHACGLKIAGYSKLNACGLGDVFTGTSRYDAAEYFDLVDPSDMYEEDFNE